MTDRLTVDSITSDQLDALYAERDEHKQDYLNACKTIAAMHKAAVGEVRGPGRGVVEDVEDVRLRAERAEGRLSHLQTTSEAAGRILASTTDERDTLQAAVERVRALHRKASHGDTCVYCAHGQRLGYDTTWPCDTIRALDEPKERDTARVEITVKPDPSHVTEAIREIRSHGGLPRR